MSAWNLLPGVIIWDTYIHIHTYIHRIHVYIIHTHCAGTYIHTYIHAYIHACIHTYIHNIHDMDIQNMFKDTLKTVISLGYKSYHKKTHT